MHAHIHTHTHIHNIHICTYTCTNMHAHIHTHTHIRACTHMHKKTKQETRRCHRDRVSLVLKVPKTSTNKTKFITAITAALFSRTKQTPILNKDEAIEKIIIKTIRKLAGLGRSNTSWMYWGTGWGWSNQISSQGRTDFTKLVRRLTESF